MPPKNRHNQDELNATERKKRALMDWFRSRKTLQTMNVMEISVQNDWNAAKELRPGAKFKDLVKELIDEGRLKSKKCGAQTMIYIFPSTEIATLVDKVTIDSKCIDQSKIQLQQLQHEYRQLIQQQQQKQREREIQSLNNGAYVDQSALLEQLAMLRRRNTELDHIIAQYSENDPVLIEELQTRTFLSYHAVNIITRNIGLLTRFFTRQFKNPPYPSSHMKRLSDVTHTNDINTFNQYSDSSMNDQNSLHFHDDESSNNTSSSPHLSVRCDSLTNLSPEEFLAQFGIDMFSFDFLTIPEKLQTEIAKFLIKNHRDELTAQDVEVLSAFTTTADSLSSSSLSSSSSSTPSTNLPVSQRSSLTTQLQQRKHQRGQLQPSSLTNTAYPSHLQSLNQPDSATQSGHKPTIQITSPNDDAFSMNDNAIENTNPNTNIDRQHALTTPIHPTPAVIQNPAKRRVVLVRKKVPGATAPPPTSQHTETSSSGMTDQ